MARKSKAPGIPRTRESLAADVSAWLGAGNKITHVPFGEGSAARLDAKRARMSPSERINADLNGAAAAAAMGTRPPRGD